MQRQAKIIDTTLKDYIITPIKSGYNCLLNDYLTSIDNKKWISIDKKERVEITKQKVKKCRENYEIWKKTWTQINIVEMVGNITFLKWFCKKVITLIT